MKLRKGAITPKEAVFVKRFVESGNATYAAEKAAYAFPQSAGHQLVNNPRLQQHIVTEQRKRMIEEALPLAVSSLIDTLKNAPVGASRNKAAEIVLKHTLSDPSAASDKEPHEMTAEELAQEIQRAKLRQAAAEREASERAKPVLEHEPDPTIFD
jgi:phage terminase small subunit